MTGKRSIKRNDNMIVFIVNVAAIILGCSFIIFLIRAVIIGNEKQIVNMKFWIIMLVFFIIIVNVLKEVIEAMISS